jgi:hypothetical protein
VVSLGLLLVFVHISLMFSAVAISYGPTLLFLIALRSGRTESVRAVGVAVAPVVRLIPIVYGLAAIAGVSAALVNEYNLLAPWLVISYVIFVALLTIGGAVAGPRLARVGQMVGPLPDGPLPAEVRATAMSGGFLWIELLDFLGLFAVIFVMVVKPFS